MVEGSISFTPEQHAAELVRTFFDRSRRDRYLRLLESGSKGRAKFRSALPHLRDLDERFVQPIPTGSQTADAILETLRELGAPSTCYLLSESANVDGRILGLEEALDCVVGMGMGAIISCVPGRLAYFEGEDPGDRAVLFRNAV